MLPLLTQNLMRDWDGDMQVVLSWSLDNVDLGKLGQRASYGRSKAWSIPIIILPILLEMVTSPQFGWQPQSLACKLQPLVYRHSLGWWCQHLALVIMLASKNCERVLCAKEKVGPLPKPQLAHSVYVCSLSCRSLEPYTVYASNEWVSPWHSGLILNQPMLQGKPNFQKVARKRRGRSNILVSRFIFRKVAKHLSAEAYNPKVLISRRVSKALPENKPLMSSLVIRALLWVFG